MRMAENMNLARGFLLVMMACWSAHAASSTAKSAADQCAAMSGLTIPSSRIGLPTTGAKVTSATWVSASNAQAGVEYCKIVGEIYPAASSEVVNGTTIATPNINFNVALPTSWNGKTLQLGGGGFDGTVPQVDSASANGIQSALARGYATLGSDSGHTTDSQLWNSEALRNFGREQIKKTHDVAVAIIRTRYGVAPRYSYFQGGSQGGHEALIAANFYPDDFNGVIAGFPAYDLYAMHPGAIDYAKALYGAHTQADGYKYPAAAGYGWMSRTQTAALTAAIVSACDALDGVADGVVSNPGSSVCRAYTAKLLKHDSSNPLRCAGGVHTSSDLTTAATELCISDVQIETLTRMNSRYNLPTNVHLAANLASYGRWPFMDGAYITGEDFGSAYNSYNAFQYMAPAVGQVQVITQTQVTSPSQVLNFNLSAYASRVSTLSGWVDASSVNYERFRNRGGKIIHYHGNADVSITPYNSIDLYMRMTGQFVGNSHYLGTNPFWGTDDLAANAKVSQNAAAQISNGVVNGFYSFYLIPGYGHGHGYFQASADWLSALENWVEQGKAPGNSLTVTDTSTTQTNGHATVGSRPLCYFPYYPKYAGSGDAVSASSYTCTKLDEYRYLK